MTGAKTANLALAFLLELAALAAVAMWGWHVGHSTLSRWVFAGGAAVVWALVWGVFFSPNAAVKLPAAAAEIGQWLMFVIALAALAATGRIALAVVFAVVVLVNRVLALGWHQ